MAALHDLRYAIRNLSKSPGFTAIAVFTLAAGIGANTAIFSVANALLLRPLPFAQPGRLALIDLQRQDSNSDTSPLSWPRYRQVSARQRSFSNLAAVTNENFTLTGRGDPEQIAAARVTWNFFDTLGVRMASGRAFRPEEDKPGGDNVAIVANGRWEVGQHLTLDSKDYTVIGGTAQGQYYEDAEILLNRLLQALVDEWGLEDVSAALADISVSPTRRPTGLPPLKLRPAEPRQGRARRRRLSERNLEASRRKHYLN